MRSRTVLGLPALLILAASVLWAAPPAVAPAPTPKLPYVYTHWKQFTVADGLPSDHIFAVKVDGPRVWVGTEDGLALIDETSGKVVKSWEEKDGLPFRAVTGIDVDPKTGDVWLALFGGGLARFSGGRFDHWHQLNSGLVNDVVYAVAIEHDNVWCATTAGASRLNTTTGEWSVFTEKNAPMEEIWNYGVSYDGKDSVYLAVWGSGVLKYDIHTGHWEEYTDPDGEMEIDLYRDDGINHVITTGVSPVDGVVWISTYFGVTRYDGRHWRGYAEQEGGLPSDFNNNVKGRNAQEALYCTDKGLGIVADAPNEDATWVAYTRDPDTGRGRARVTVGGKTVENVDMPVGLPHSFTIAADVDGNDIWIGTAKGLAWGIGDGYYPGTKERPLYAYGQPAPEAPPAAATGTAGPKEPRTAGRAARGGR
jgi:ligand-binding sensor domain-containing protein